MATPTVDGQGAAQPETDPAKRPHPGFREAVVADARIAAAFRSERHDFESTLDTVLQVLRLMLVTDAFLGQVAYRLKVALVRRRIPVLPSIAQRVAMVSAQISIGDLVVVAPGVFMPHGQVVVEGVSDIAGGAVLFPWITIGLLGPGVKGPTIGPLATIGTGARVLGPVTVGARARVGANAVVVDDVPDGVTVVGMPARSVSED